MSLRGGIEKRPGCVLFSFTGQLDAYSDKHFKDYVVLHKGKASLPILLDLTHIDYIDSSGLGVLVQIAKLCADDGTRFLLVGNARVVQTIKLVRLEEFLHLQPDLTTALGALATA